MSFSPNLLRNILIFLNLGFLIDQIVLFSPLLLGGKINKIHPYENIYSKRLLLLKNNIKWNKINNARTYKKNKKI
jgi:hypothetical protein